MMSAGLLRFSFAVMTSVMVGHAFAAAPAATAAIAPISAGASDFLHVPELAIWAMMLLGFAVIGVAYRTDIRKLMRAFV